MSRLPIDAVKVGERHRQKLGDIDALAASIAKHGLLQPVVITPDDLLVDGERRLAACRSLGHYEVEVNVVDPDDLLGAELDANEQRKNFTRSEAVAIGRIIEKREQPAAVERQRKGWEKRGCSAPYSNLESGPRRQSNAVSVIAAKSVGLSPTSYSRAKEVVEAAEQNPEQYGDLQAHMDETGNMSGAHRLLRQRQVTAPKSAKPPPSSKPRVRVYKDKPDREVVDRAMNALEQVALAFDGVAHLPIASEDQLTEWVRIMRHSSKSLRRFQRLLQTEEIADAS